MALVFGLFGLIIGSFLNVVILRRSVRSLSGRSGCLSCRAPLSARDLIPVLSYVSLRGRCRRCGSRISLQYPLVELATALLFAAVGGAPIPLIARLVGCVIVSLLVCIAAYDMRHTIIPDEWAIAFALCALVAGRFTVASPTIALELFAGVLAPLPLFALWLVSRGKWMGLGDAKLAVGIGFLLGPILGVFAVFFAFIIGAVISLTILVPLPYYRRFLKMAGIALTTSRASYTMTSEVPFGPFLILSCIYVWLSLQYALPIPLLP